VALNYASFIWSVADLLRGSFKAHQYGDIILPFTVLRRLDCVLAPTKSKVLAAAAQADEAGLPVNRGLLKAKAGHALSFWNTSPFDLGKLLGDPDNLAANLMAYINAFSPDVADIFSNYAHLTAETPRSTIIALPPQDEQCLMVAQVSNAHQTIDATVADARLDIELSRERWAALITAAVTGQIAVRTGRPRNVSGDCQTGLVADQRGHHGN